MHLKKDWKNYLNKFLISFFLLNLNFESVLANFDFVPCNYSNCSKKFDITATKLIKANNDRPMILWLGGGNGMHTSRGPIDLLEGKYDIITVMNPYDINIGRYAHHMIKLKGGGRVCIQNSNKNHSFDFVCINYIKSI